MAPVELLLGSATPFLDGVFSALERDGIDVSDSLLDHICYRVEDYSRYNFLKTSLRKFGELISEAKINGRPISNFKLEEPIVFGGIGISVLELPAPKEGVFYPEGYEHVEFAVKMHPRNFAKLYPRVKFDMNDSSKDLNPDVKRIYDGFSVKFHEYSLEYVINNLE